MQNISTSQATLTDQSHLSHIQSWIWAKTTKTYIEEGQPMKVLTTGKVPQWSATMSCLHLDPQLAQARHIVIFLILPLFQDKIM